VPPFKTNIIRSNYNVVAAYLAPPDSEYDLYLRISVFDRWRPMFVPLSLPPEAKQAIAAYKQISKSIYLEHDEATDSWAALFTADNSRPLPADVIAAEPIPATLAPFFPDIKTYDQRKTRRYQQPKTTSCKQHQNKTQSSAIAKQPPTKIPDKPKINVSITIEPGEAMRITMRAAGDHMITELYRWLIEDLFPRLWPKFTTLNNTETNSEIQILV